MKELLGYKGRMKVHAAVTGAGALLAPQLWNTPGSSDYLSGFSMPYSPEETEAFLGFRPEKFCSIETAIDMASKAFMKAADGGTDEPVGLGLSASVASVRARRGDHALHAAVITKGKVLGLSIVIDKGIGEEQRMEDDRDAAFCVLELLRSALGMYSNHPGHDMRDEATSRLFKRPYFDQTGKRHEMLPRWKAIFPGAFNPPHEGHLEIGETARRQMNGDPVVFYMTADPPHKPPLTVQEMLLRATKLRGHNFAFSLGDSLYIEKARKHPGSCFIIGADALMRMLDPKWGPEIDPMLMEFKALETRFLVVGRMMEDRYVQLKDIQKAKEWPNFHELSGRWDVSSTQLRGNR